MIIPFTHMGCFLLTSHLDNNLDFCDRELKFSFRNYVLCCLSMPLLVQLTKRDFKLYWQAKTFMEGDQRNEPAYKTVLKYFYEDMSNLVSNAIKKRPDQEDNPFLITLSDAPIPEDCLINQVSHLEIVKGVGDALESKSSKIGSEFVTKFTVSELENLKPNKRLACLAILASAGKKVDASIVVEVI